MIKYLLFLIVFIGCDLSNKSRAPDGYYLMRFTGEGINLFQFKSNGEYVRYHESNFLFNKTEGDYQMKKDTVIMIDRFVHDIFGSEPSGNETILVYNPTDERISYPILDGLLWLDKIDSLTHQHILMIEKLDILNNDASSPTRKSSR